MYTSEEPFTSNKVQSWGTILHIVTTIYLQILWEVVTLNTITVITFDFKSLQLLLSPVHIITFPCTCDYLSCTCDSFPCDSFPSTCDDHPMHMWLSSHVYLITSHYKCQSLHPQHKRFFPHFDFPSLKNTLDLPLNNKMTSVCAFRHIPLNTTFLDINLR